MTTAAPQGNKSTQREKLNALIHASYTRKDFHGCLKKIDEQLRACNGQSEYPLYIKALIQRHQGRIEESLAAFQAALCLNPTNVSNLKQVGRSLYLLGRHKQALEAFDEAEQLDPEDRDVWHNKGMCFLYLKQYARSLECFEGANSIQRAEATYSQMGRVYRLTGRDEQALSVYMEALELCPESPDLLTTVGLLFLKLGDNTKAFEFLGNSLTFDPRSAKTILAAGSIIQDNQDMDVALVKYRVAGRWCVELHKRRLFICLFIPPWCQIWSFHLEHTLTGPSKTLQLYGLSNSDASQRCRRPTAPSCGTTSACASSARARTWPRWRV
jgi:Bardet-Biedl syndrome 4 protein